MCHTDIQKKWRKRNEESIHNKLVPTKGVFSIQQPKRRQLKAPLAFSIQGKYPHIFTLKANKMSSQNGLKTT
jgi:hypothetical protein